MRRSLFLPFASVWLLGASALAPAAQFKIGPHNFTVPDGFEVELAAGTNLVLRPVSASLDDRGRLYVTDSSGSNAKPDEQLKNPSARVLRLEDTDGDGHYDKTVVFADKVMFPQGCLWHDGAVYVAGPPSIWKFTDTQGTGVAGQREEWFKGGTLTGCANDIHGPYLGPDGYIYWTKGAFSEQTHLLGNGRQLKDRAAHIYRARPDGSDLDVIMSGGMDNPVEVAFTPEGEAIFTSTFIDFSQPGFRDGIAHAVYGGVYGKQNDVLEDGRVKRTSPELMHPFYEAGPAAQCALTRYESDVFGAAYRDSFFATTFNLHKVTRHILRPNGATFASTDSDFLVSDNPDFHPTDVLEDTDGSLLVVDTGGWYKLCCPSSQLAKADVLGSIYRVRRTGAGKVDRAAVLAAKKKERARVAQTPYALAKQVALRRDATAQKQMLEMLAANVSRPADDKSSSTITPLHLARVAAEALGRIGRKDSVPALLAALEKSNDATLHHSVTYALIEIGDPAGTSTGLEHPNAAVRRASVMALDQMDNGALKPERVAALLAVADPALSQTAAWIIGRHADWAELLAGFMRERLTAPGQSDSQRSEWSKQLGLLSRRPAGQQLIADVLTQSSPRFSAETRLAALGAMSNAGLKQTPALWNAALLTVLNASGAGSERLPAIRAVRSLNWPKEGAPDISAALMRLARDNNVPADTRLDALAAVPGALPAAEPELFDFLRSNLEPAKPVMTRSAAAGVLAKAKLSLEQQLKLTETLKTAGPLEISKLLGAFEGASDETLGLKLIAALQSSKGLSGLRADLLKPRMTNFPVNVQQQGEALLASLNADAAKQKAHLDDLSAQLKGGDVRRGQVIFNSPKAACVSCHAVGYLGGKVGPDLTKIGEARTARDLLESIVYPSASFVRSYEPMIVVTKTGDELSGVLRKDAEDEVVLVSGPDTESHIARGNILEMRPGTVSVMPQGLDEQLTHQELADLLAFLKNTKWGPQ